MNDIPIENIDDRQVHVYVPIASRFQGRYISRC